ncbi:MAG: acyl carrier protein [Alphaproteobacteria bacterium]
MMRTPLDIARDVFHAEDNSLQEGEDLRELPNWDSLNHMKFIAALESEYEVELSGEEIAEMLNLGVIRQILRERHGLQL